MIDNSERDASDKVSISVIDILTVLWSYKLLIALMTFGGMAIALAISIISLKQPPDRSILPNEYTPKAIMLINSSSSNDPLTSLLSSSGLGNIAGLSGGNTATYADLAVFLTGTNSFLDSIVTKFNIIENYKIVKSPKATSRGFVQKKLKVEMDKASGVLIISYTDKDPVFAQSVVNYAVEYIARRFDEMGLDKNLLSKRNLEKNIEITYKEILDLEKETRNMMDNISTGRSLPGGLTVTVAMSKLQLELGAKQEVYRQLKTQYELLKVQMSSEAPVFQVLEYAEVPDQKSRPSRGKLCMIITMMSLFVGIFSAFILEAIKDFLSDQNTIARILNAKKP